MQKSKDEVKFVNMTDDDVDRIQGRVNKLSNKEIDEVNKLCTSFHQALVGLVTTARSFTKEDEELVEIDRIKRLLAILPQFEVFVRAQGRIWTFRNKIVDKDMDFFLGIDYSGAIKRDHKQRMIETIIEIVKEKFPKLPESERETFWQKVILLLNYTAKFRKVVGEI